VCVDLVEKSLHERSAQISALRSSLLRASFVETESGVHPQVNILMESTEKPRIGSLVDQTNESVSPSLGG
jgi:hypothetical protein